jgi:hypothetical protein
VLRLLEHVVALRLNVPHLDDAAWANCDEGVRAVRQGLLDARYGGVAPSADELRALARRLAAG